jgi:F-type H+-transporting ATPase subunit b
MPSPEAWVALAFVCFLGVLVYLGAHRKVVDRLDRHQARIKGELHEAVRLREDAQALLSEVQRNALAAEGEAEAVIASAKAEAEGLAAEAKLRMEDLVARRTRLAETKIAQAEAQALADVRGAAADAAVAVAERILKDVGSSDVRNALLSHGIRDVRSRLNGGQAKIALDAAE